MQLRTVSRTVVYVPNGTLATMEVENLSRRDKFLFNPVVGLRYETTLEQLQRVATDIKASLTTDDRVENSTLRVRLARFGAYSLDVECSRTCRRRTTRRFSGAGRAPDAHHGHREVRRDRPRLPVADDVREDRLAGARCDADQDARLNPAAGLREGAPRLIESDGSPGTMGRVRGR